MTYNQRDERTKTDSVVILSGELRGVSVPFGAGALRIGSDPSCDVVLLTDADSISAMSEATLTSSPDEAYRVGLASGEVRVGRRYLKPGKSVELKSGVPFSVANVEMVMAPSLCAADHAVRRYRRRTYAAMWATSSALAVALIGAVGLSGSRGAVDASPISMSGLAVENEQALGKPQHAADALGSRLAGAGLDRLTASVDHSGRVINVTGKVRPSQHDSWRDIRAWFDSTHGASIQLTAEIEEISDSLVLPFSIHAIWMGNAPRLILHDGSRAVPGDPLPGGWLLKAISKDTITITKDSETLVVPL